MSTLASLPAGILATLQTLAAIHDELDRSSTSANERAADASHVDGAWRSSSDPRRTES
jgi:hypothetical protein